VKPVPVKGYPYAFHIALDGNGVNGLEGLAGVCLFLFDPTGDRHAYKIVYFDGAAAGHAVSVNPSGTVGYLGNAGQHLLFYDAHTLAEVERISTLRFETARTSLQGSTHVVWLNDQEIVTPIGEHFYRFRLGDLENPERLVRHGVKLPHGMKPTASGRYVVYGSMDNPADGEAGEARHVGIWDRQTDRVTVLELPATCWHVAVHPREEIFYAVSFRVAPQDHRDFHDWGMAFRKEYAFEIDARTKKVVRHWAAGREVPAHINSDITLSERELIFCNGGSQSIVAIELENFARFRIIDERPDRLPAFGGPVVVVHREPGAELHHDLRLSGGGSADTGADARATDVSTLVVADGGSSAGLPSRSADRMMQHVSLRAKRSNPDRDCFASLAMTAGKRLCRRQPERRSGFHDGAQVAGNDRGDDGFHEA
jgi:hypothetical protein